MKYELLMGKHRDELEEKVSKYLSAGWRLLGGVAVVIDEGYYEDDRLIITAWGLIQAMVKDKKQGPQE